MNRLRLATLTLALSVLASQVQAACDPSPVIIAIALRHYKGWSLVTNRDLDPYDQQLWRTYHDDQCPGLASLDLDGRKVPAYAIAIRHRGPGPAHEILLLVSGTAKSLSTVVVADVPNAGVTKVVWRAPPGPVREFSTGRITNVAHDAFVFEAMEATATAYYIVKGRLRSILTTD